jgi:hypothetical protein
MALQISFDDIVLMAEDIKTEITALTPAQKALILLEVEGRVVEKIFKQKTKLAQIYYGAHLANVMISPAPGQGTISSENYAGESISYTMPTNNPAGSEWLLTSNYGKIFNEIKRSMIVPVRVY